MGLKKILWTLKKIGFKKYFLLLFYRENDSLLNSVINCYEYEWCVAINNIDVEKECSLTKKPYICSSRNGDIRLLSAGDKIRIVNLRPLVAECLHSRNSGSSHLVGSFVLLSNNFIKRNETARLLAEQNYNHRKELRAKIGI